MAGLWFLFKSFSGGFEFSKALKTNYSQFCAQLTFITATQALQAVINIAS
jgi:hypothetical protein